MHAEAGVVDEAVDAQTRSVEAFAQQGGRVIFTEVECDDVGPDVVIAGEAVGQFAQAILPAREEHDVAAAASELRGELGAEARAGAGDERGAGNGGCHTRQCRH